MDRKAFQYILYSIVIVLFLEHSECCYNGSHVSCSSPISPDSLICSISKYNSTQISNALKICTFGKGYQEACVDLNVSESSIELPLELSDTVTSMTIRNVGSSPLYISILPVKKHSNLTTLYLCKTNLNISSNDLLTNNFPNLKDIYFNQVYFVEMLDNFLTGLKSLSRIEWSGGSLVNISENAFEGLTSLSYINLSSNSISYLPSQAFQNLPSLRILDVRGNPLNCSACGLQWMSIVDSFNISIAGNCTDTNTRVDSVSSHSHCHSTESYQCFNKSIKCENTCINTPLSYICTCDEGFGLSLKETEQTCYDIDECLHDVTLCQGMKCRNTLGSYECDCEEGFYVEGNSCLDVDECSSNPCEYACNNTVGSYECLPNIFSIFTIALIAASGFLIILLILSSICLFITCCCYFKKHKQTTTPKAVLSSTADETVYIDGSTLKQILPKKGKQKHSMNSGDEHHNGIKQPVSNLAANEEHCYVNTDCSQGSAEVKGSRRTEYSHYVNFENID